MPSLRKLGFALLTGSLLVLSACVTINVYFPAAEAEQAAREFVDKVIGPNEAERKAPPPADSGKPPSLGLLSFLISDAHAQSADINLKTPAIQAIQQRMATRFQSQLAPAFEAGALGFGNDGLIVLRDASQVGLRERAALNQALAEDNRDRNALYREVAVANGHPEWEQQIRETFARQWIEGARSGWWYQDPQGNWKQK
ncbi:YdbL family protein [Pseudomarimonas salicorniae]|uniref:YdbL family protein n=1 Tax=Pseudomarimonas salicorniae TaxID=2933270 RepID=A0ABT0GJS0_9GAMM|nr:YdbL family protein [Lysobacter sp. CAU 1642]MCK7594799.1 YdbL family protein [Lysobacter sp. CAU 1642]